MTRHPSAEQFAEAHDIARRRADKELDGRAWEGVSAEDVVQDVMVKFMGLDVDRVENWRAWVEVIARNRCYDVRRGERRRRGKDDRDPLDLVDHAANWIMGPSAPAMDPLLTLYVLEELSAKEQAMLIRQSQGASNIEIAAEFGYATPDSAKVAISKAKKKVRDRFSTSERDSLLGHPRPY